MFTIHETKLNRILIENFTLTMRSVLSSCSRLLDSLLSVNVCANVFTTHLTYHSHLQKYSELAIQGNFTEHNGPEIVKRLSHKLSGSFAEIEDALRESSRLIAGMYDDTGCCSEACVGERRREDCMKVCNASSPALTEYYRAQYGLETGDDENGMETEEDIVMIDDVDFRPLFGRNVSFNTAAVHIPLDIYQEGVYVCMCVCVYVCICLPLILLFSLTKSTPFTFPVVFVDSVYMVYEFFHFYANTLPPTHRPRCAVFPTVDNGC